MKSKKIKLFVFKEPGETHLQEMKILRTGHKTRLFDFMSLFMHIS